MAKTCNRIYTSTDVQNHTTRLAAYLSLKGSVYDITSFLPNHPGGDDIILDYVGGDIGQIMGDDCLHVHSKSAYLMLEECKIGVLGEGDPKTISEDWVPKEDFHPDETDALADYNRNKFLDLSKPLLIQMWRANFSKEYYLRQVHNPRHLKESARLFGNKFLESFTRTTWYVVPLIWGPITAFLFILSLMQFDDESVTARSLFGRPTTMSAPSLAAFMSTMACFIARNTIWTILEYTFHQFVFHVDYYLPEANWALFLHFLLHGNRHYLPMDRLRLVMPPTLFLVLEAPFTKLAHSIFPKAIANGIIAGAFTFYILYDCMHYALHHTRLPRHMAEMKRYHLAHHYKNFELGFGITSKIWDHVFNSVLPIATK